MADVSSLHPNAALRGPRVQQKQAQSRPHTPEPGGTPSDPPPPYDTRPPASGQDQPVESSSTVGDPSSAQYRKSAPESTQKLDDQRAKLLGSLLDFLQSHHIEYTENGEDVYQKQVSVNTKGTCQWILNTEDFKEWETRDTGVLMLIGDPGMGKSVAAKAIIVDRSKTDDSSAPTAKPLGFFCRSSMSNRNSAVSLVSSILYQLLREKPSLRDGISMDDFPETVNFDSLWKIFLVLAKDPYVQQKLFVVDALDECDDGSQEQIRKALLRSFRRNEETEWPKLRMLITSRPSPNTRILEKRFMYIRMDAQKLKGDLEKFIQVNLDDLGIFELYPGTVTGLLKEDLGKRAGGMFLWVKLILDDFEQATEESTIEISPKAIDRFLSKIPNGLEGYWLAMIKKSATKGDAQAEEAARILGLLLASRESFNNQQLAVALSLSTTDFFSNDELLQEMGHDAFNRAQKFCGPLVRIANDGIEIVHKSARDFLQQLPKSQGRLNIPREFVSELSHERMHLNLAVACLRCLLLPGSGNSSRLDMSSNPFLRYALNSWHLHVREAGRSIHAFGSLVQDFLKPGSDPYTRWLEFDGSERGSGTIDKDAFEYLQPVQVIARFGLTELIRKVEAQNDHENKLKLFELDVDINSKTEKGGCTPLLLVTQNNWSHEACRVLLNLGADPKIPDKKGFFPLTHAVKQKNLETVRLLLAHGADPCESQEGVLSPLFQVIDVDAYEIFKLLLQDGKNLRHTQNNDCSLLHKAARLAKVQMSRYLIEQDFPDEPDDMGWRPMHAACYGGSLEIYQMMFQKGFDVNCSAKRGNTPMHEAARYGYIQLVNRLLRDSKKTDEANEFGWTPLMYAANEGHDEVAKALLAHGSSIGSKNTKDGRTSLYLAAEAGKASMIKILKDAGGDLNGPPDKNGYTPLMAASDTGKAGVVSYLLENGVALDSKDENNRTALYWAVKSDNVGIAKELLEHGADMSIPTDGDQWTPLLTAVCNGNHETTRMLLEKGADIEAELSMQFNALQVLGWYNDDVKLAELLLEHGADPFHVIQQGRTILHIAAEKGHLNLIEWVIEQASKPDGLKGTPFGSISELVAAKNKHGQTALYVAALAGKTSTVRFLLKHDLDVDCPTNSGWTPLHGAAETGDLESVKEIFTLANWKARARNMITPTPLWCAAKKGRDDIVEFLLKEGMDQRANRFGNTPLHEAARSGNASTVTMLLKSGADVSALNTNMQEPAALAVIENKTDVLEILAKNGANLLARSGEYKWSLLALAVKNESLETFKMLKSLGADGSRPDVDCRYPLYLAAWENSTEMLTDLVKEPDAPITKGTIWDDQPPVVGAALAGSTGSILILKEAGADLSLRDAFGFSASDWTLELPRKTEAAQPCHEHEYDIGAFNRKPKLLETLHRAISGMQSLIHLQEIRQTRRDDHRIQWAAYDSLLVALSLLGDPDNAQIAAEQQLRRPTNGDRNDSTSCRNCDKSVTGAYRCRICPRVHLCEECHSKRSEAPCAEHPFDEFPSSKWTSFAPGIIDEAGTSEKEWLNGLRTQYPLPPGFSPTHYDDLSRKAPQAIADATERPWIHDLCRSAQVDEIRELLATSPGDVEMDDSDGNTPLFSTILSDLDDTNTVQVLQALLSGAPEFFVYDKNKQSMAQCCAKSSKPESLAFVLSFYDVDFDKTDNGGPEVLRTALKSGWRGAIDMAVSRHFQWIAQEQFVWLWDLYPAGFGDSEIVEILLQAEGPMPEWEAFDIPNDPPTIKPGYHRPNCVHLKFRPPPAQHASPSENGAADLDSSEGLHAAGQYPLDPELLKRRVTSPCGFAGVQSKEFEQLLDFDEDVQDLDEGRVSVHFADRDASTALQRLVGVVDRLCDAVAEAQRGGACCDRFAILHQHPHIGLEGLDLDAVKMSEISVSVIQRFQEMLCHAKPSSASLKPCALLAIEVLQDLGLLSSSVTGESASDLSNMLHYCSLLAQTLCLALASFAQNHVGAFHPFFLNQPVGWVVLHGTTKNANKIVAHTVSLGCIGRMITDDVFVFASGEAADNHTSGYVLASAENLSDLWGPGYFISKPGSLEKGTLLALEIGGGNITSSGPDESGIPQAHWESGFCNFTKLQTTFGSAGLMYIGAITMNKECPLNQGEVFRNTAPYHCQLHTHPDFWALKEQAHGIQAGQYLVATSSMTFERQSRPLKPQLIARWLRAQDNSVLNEPWGLLLSLCTGIAKRVTLSEFLAHTLPVLLRNQYRRCPPALRRQIPNQWEIFIDDMTTALEDNNVPDWESELPSDELRAHFRAAVTYALQAFQDSGFEPSNTYFRVAWPQESGAHMALQFPCRGEMSWLTVLRDSDNCATFAAFARGGTCFEYAGNACNQERSWNPRLHFLETFVLRNLQGELIPRQLPQTPDRLKPEERYWFGKKQYYCATFVRKNPQTDGPSLLLMFQIRKNFNPVVWAKIVGNRGTLMERQQVSLGECVLILSGEERERRPVTPSSPAKVG